MSHNSEFSPPSLLQNPHVQSLLASTAPRKLRLIPKVRQLRRASKSVILDCGNGSQLLGEYSPQQQGRSRGLITLIHGWEGSSRSTYLLSAASAFYRAGYDVFRLNLRDHGPSHHLNRELFNSTLLEEVLGALRAIQANYPHDWQFLAGFSLGGNFALRLAAAANEAGIHIHQTIAICPVVDPVKTMAAIEQGWWVYEQYFVRKWKRSLKKKLALYPELNFSEQLHGMRRLRDFNDYFVPNHTPFNEPDEYFRAYALSADLLSTLSNPAHIIAAQDDPMIIAEDFEQLRGVKPLSIETPRFGGHCGFVKNWRLDSWVDDRMLEIIQLRKQQPRETATTATAMRT